MAVVSSDPVYSAFLSNLGFQEDTAKRRAEEAQTTLTGQAEVGREDLAIGQERSQRGVSSVLENRGLTRSGEHERRLAEGQQDYLRRLSAFESGVAGQSAGIQASLEDQLADLQMRDAQAQYEAQVRAAERAGRGY